jgi:hypothetical protein
MSKPKLPEAPEVDRPAPPVGPGEDDDATNSR